MSFTNLTSKSTQNVNLPYLASKFTQTSHLIVYPYLPSKFTQILNLLVCLLSDIRIHPNSKFSCFLFAFKVHLNAKPSCLYHVYLQSSPFSFSFIFYSLILSTNSFSNAFCLNITKYWFDVTACELE